MAKQLQIRRGTTMANDVFIGAEGEITMDTTTKGLRIHDGQTAGGFKIDTVVDFQVPTSSNNYTWYRKYASGWVEQGGNIDDGTSHTEKTINLPVAMANTMYNIDGRCVNDSSIETGNDVQPRFGARTTTTVKYRILVITGNPSSNRYVFTWQVSGMAA